MDELKALDNHHPHPTLGLPIVSWEVHTPLVLQEWITELAVHPDQLFFQYILEGIQKSFNRSHILSLEATNFHCNNLSLETTNFHYNNP